MSSQYGLMTLVSAKEANELTLENLEKKYSFFNKNRQLYKDKFVKAITDLINESINLSEFSCIMNKERVYDQLGLDPKKSYGVKFYTNLDNLLEEVAQHFKNERYFVHIEDTSIIVKWENV